jgi:hypothetical protein
MTDRVTKDTMLKSDFTFTGKRINEKYNKSNVWTKKNALRELNQKRIKDNREIIKKKKECLIERGLWKCPHCLREVKRLTCAHTGMPVSKIIDDILEQNPDENDICKLDKIVQDIHDTIIIIICCDQCNTLIDDSK